MIKRTVEISQNPVYLSIKNNQIVLNPKDEDINPVSVPCEDIGLLLVDQPGTTYSHKALTALLGSGATVIFCNDKHLPEGMLLPFANHTEVVWRLQAQMDVSKPVHKSIWQQIIREKIRNQAANLANDSKAYTRLMTLSQQVRSGDPTNVEAQAARVYWSAWMLDSVNFRRNPDGEDILNGMLNYGYAVIRAAVARVLVSAGLQPALGIFHANRGNAFCLADDLMEPFRPWVDRVVRTLHENGVTEINKEAKAPLLQILSQTVQTGEQQGPLMVALHSMAASLVRCYEGSQKQLLIPSWCEGEDGCT